MFDFSLTDTHTHILPGMDDGAADLSESEALLRRQKELGVDRVIVTPHFYCQRESQASFLSRRQEAWDTLRSAWDPDTMPEIRLGAEVRYSPSLAELDLHELTLCGGDFLLLELSDTRYPTHIGPMIRQFSMEGIIPVLAHVERCAYFRQQPELLLELIEAGALAQVTASVLRQRSDKGFALACLQNGLAHFVVSDTHHPETRPPCLSETRDFLDPALLDEAEEFAMSVWDSVAPPYLRPSPVKKGLFGYR